MYLWAALSIGALVGAGVASAVAYSRGWEAGLTLGTRRGYAAGKEAWKNELRVHAEASRRPVDEYAHLPQFSVRHGTPNHACGPGGGCPGFVD